MEIVSLPENNAPFLSLIHTFWSLFDENAMLAHFFPKSLSRLFGRLSKVFDEASTKSKGSFTGNERDDVAIMMRFDACIFQEASMKRPSTYYSVERSIFDSSHNNYRDDDGDGLDDEMENKLAEAFRPIVVNDSSENATRHAVYTDVTGASVIEPVVAFQVRQSAIHSNAITLMYMKLWMNDKGSGCDEHKGDTQSTPIHLMTPSGQEYGKKWWLYSTSYNPTNITSSTASSNALVSTSNVSEDENFDMETIAEQEAKEREKLLLNNDIYDFYSDSDLERMALNLEAETLPF